MNEDVRECLKMATDAKMKGDMEGYKELMKLAKRLAGKE